MTRFVIEPQVAIALAAADSKVAPCHTLLAPTLLRSQVLALLYAEAGSGQISRKEASRRLDYLSALKVRLLGDRVLQRVAWEIAQELGWQDTFVAEYLALTRLQGDALVTDSPELAESAGRVVTVASMSALLV